MIMQSKLQNSSPVFNRQRAHWTGSPPISLLWLSLRGLTLSEKSGPYGPSASDEQVHVQLLNKTPYKTNLAHTKSCLSVHSWQYQCVGKFGSIWQLDHTAFVFMRVPAPAATQHRRGWERENKQARRLRWLGAQIGRARRLCCAAALLTSFSLSLMLFPWSLAFGLQTDKSWLCGLLRPGKMINA